MAHRAVSVALFCGGRGSVTLIRELARHTELKTNLLVNAYDDGLSTGELRHFIPGMLGPSDFRKNLSYLLDFSATYHYSFAKILEYRFPLTFDENQLKVFVNYVRTGSGKNDLLPEMQKLFSEIKSEKQNGIRGFIKKFFEFL